MVKGSDGLLFWKTFQKQCDNSKASRKQGRPPECPVSSDLNTFPAPTPEPIFRIHRFEFIQSEVSPISGNRSSILEGRRLKELLNSFPRKFTHTDSCESNDTDNNSDGDVTEIRSQVCPTPKKDSAQNKPFLEFGENISQVEFATQVHQITLQHSSFKGSDLTRQKAPRVEGCKMDELCGQPWAISSVASGTNKTIELSSNNKSFPNPCEVDASFTAGSCEEASSSNLVSSPSQGGAPDAKKKTLHSCRLSQDQALPLSPMVCLHPGWGGMMEVTKSDVIIPKDQLAALDIESGKCHSTEHEYWG